MQSIPATELVSPIAPNDKVIPLSKQRIDEARHQPISKTASVSLTNSALMEPQIAMIVHDMRNPLCVILNVLKACQKMSLDQLEQTRLTLALEEAERLKRMSDEILAQSRSPRQAIVLWQAIQLMDLIDEVIQLTTDLTIAAGRRIILLPNSLDATVKGDRDKLKQVLLNLLTNACEAVCPGDTITVYTQLVSCTNQISIQIHNGGQLIPPHLISALGHRSITTKPSGHGLGLMIVREIIDAHAGTLEIKSSEGRGTTVCVQLPIEDVTNYQPTSEIRTHSSPRLSAREADILQLLMEGYSNRKIAQTLFISVNTVKTHVCNLMNKLGVEGRTQIIVKALRTGLVQ